MAITNLKFASGDFAGQDIASLPDRPGSTGMTAAQLKARFDNIGKAMLALGKFNDLIDALQSVSDGNSGADNIAVTEIATAAGVSVQEVLEALAAKLATIEEGAEVNHISAANAADLTDGGNSTLHYHAADRATKRSIGELVRPGQQK